MRGFGFMLKYKCGASVLPGEIPNEHLKMCLTCRQMSKMEWMEINRRVLHPVGLALAAVIDDDGLIRFAGVQDSRDDPEGLVFGNLSKPESINTI